MYILLLFYDVITVDYCKCILLYSPLNSYVYVHWILDFKYILLLLFGAGRAHYNSLVDGTGREPAHCNVTGLSQKNKGVSVALYSFDYAQTIHLPYNPMQVGPLYIIALRKVGLFGVCAEGVGKQVS